MDDHNGAQEMLDWHKAQSNQQAELLKEMTTTIAASISSMTKSNEELVTSLTANIGAAVASAVADAVSKLDAGRAREGREESIAALSGLQTIQGSAGPAPSCSEDAVGVISKPAQASFMARKLNEEVDKCLEKHPSKVGAVRKLDLPSECSQIKVRLGIFDFAALAGGEDALTKLCVIYALFSCSLEVCAEGSEGEVWSEAWEADFY